MLALRLGDGADRLAVGDLGEGGVDLHPELAGDTGQGHLEVVVAQPGQDRLAGLRPPLDADGGILLRHPGEGTRQLLLVLIRTGGDGQLHDRGGLGHGDDHGPRPGRAQGHTGPGLVGLGHGGDLTHPHRGHVLVLLALHPEQVVHPHLPAPGHLQLGVDGDGAREDPEHRNPPHERVGDRLEDVGDRRALGRDLELPLGEGRDGMLQRVGTEVDQELGQGVDADQPVSRGHQDREHLARQHPLVDRLHDHVPGRLGALEVRLHEGVVGLDHRLHQCGVSAVDEVGDGLGEIDLLAGGGAVGVFVGPLRHHPHQPRQPALLAERHLDRGHSLAERLPELVQGPLERGPVAVELGHDDRPGNPFLARRPPHQLRGDLDAVHGGDHEQGEVGGPQRRPGVTGEIGVAGGVDEVDDVAVPLGGRHRQAE